MRVAIVTISDGVAAGRRADTSGGVIADWAAAEGCAVVERLALPDEQHRIAATLIRLSDGGNVDLVITTGGTGLTDRDNTPEATRAAIEREAPGVAEAIRQRGAAATPFTWLSRGVAGVRGRTLIVNLPGSEGGVRDGLAVLHELAAHAVQLLRGIETERHPHPDG